MGNLFFAVALCAAQGYLLGSLSFSIIVSKALKGQDIRNYGSKNAGMTNILRTYGKKYAVLCGVGDLAKGLAAVLLGRFLFSIFGIGLFDAGYIAGAAAVLGHMFPLYFGFRGGKGVLTGLGVVIALSPLTIAIILAVVLPILFFSKIVSLASVTGAALYPFATLAVHLLQGVRGAPLALDTAFAAVFGGVILFMHRANIQRLVNGTEYRFGQKKGPLQDAPYGGNPADGESPESRGKP